MKIVNLLFAITVLALPAYGQEKKVSAKPASGGDAAATIRRLEDRWEAAYLNRDTHVLEEVLASDYAGVGHDGKLQTKATLISEMKNDSDTVSQANLSKTKVRLYGPYVGVAIGDARERGTDKSKKAFDRTYRYTDTWVERAGKWECVAEQVAQVSGGESQK